MKYITSYSISKWPCGIIQLLINTEDKGMCYHEYTRGHYVVGPEDGDDGWDELKIEEQLFQLDPTKKYISTSYVEKDQILIMYIPYDKETVQAIETIYQSENL